MKHARNLFSALAICVLALAAGCANLGGANATPMDKAIAAATTSYTALDSAIVAADGAVKANQLKGSDARNALNAFTQAKKGLDVGLATLKAAQAAASAASGVK